MKHIPSNFTLEEVLKTLPSSGTLDLIQGKLETFFGDFETLQAKLESFYKEAEIIEEQSHFREDLLNEILDIIKQPGSKKELVKAINLAYDESQVEL